MRKTFAQDRPLLRRLIPIFAAVLLLLFGGLNLWRYFYGNFLPCGIFALICLYGGLLQVPVLIPYDKKAGTLLRLLTEFIFLAGFVIVTVLLFGRKTSVYSVSWAEPLGCIIAFILLVIEEKFCLHIPEDNERETALCRTAASVCAYIRLCLVPLFCGEVTKLLGLYDALTALCWIEGIAAAYIAFFSFINLCIRFIKKESYASPDLSVPLPFSPKKNAGLLSYLENSTGITMRSLWSIKFGALLLPWAACGLILLVWLATGIHTVEPYETGALWRCGSLISTGLEPGIHLTFPWPIDTVEKYDTESVRKITVGYESSGDTDNIWTGGHGTNEFKLLLGNGNELVSVNLRLEYKISDLKAYLCSSSSPEGVLRGKAYELITSTVVKNDLSSLLSVDRSSFAAEFENELTEIINADGGIGLEIVSVVLESIHPPVDVAEKYQELISAEIQAEQKILEAGSYRAITVAAAEASRDTAINEALASKYSKIAEAQASVTEFMAAVSADSSYSQAYRYHRYLNALCTAYGNAKLVLVGDGIDRSCIWLGTLPAASN